MFSALTKHRTLVRQLLVREIAARYRGSIMGILWSLVTPILMLGIYTFVFSYVFKARWAVQTNDGTVLNFALMLFSGLLIHGMIADVLVRSPRLILDNTNFVKKVVFPLETLSWIVLLSTLFNFIIGFMLLLGFVYWELQYIPITVLWLPVILVPFLFMLIGISWLLASLSVYIRDIQQISGTLATFLLFLSPIFYSVTILPESLQPIIYLNPIAFVVEAFRNIVIYGLAPDFNALLTYSVAAIVMALCGFATFQRMRRGFADVV
jgi:lipopolysaccharide transport system permease protein